MLWVAVQVRSWGGYRGISKSLRSVNSIRRTKKIILISYGKDIEGRRKRANPSGPGVSGQHGNPAKYAHAVALWIAHCSCIRLSTLASFMSLHENACCMESFLAQEHALEFRATLMSSRRTKNHCPQI